MNNEFEYVEAFPLADLNFEDKRYMGRVDRTRWEEQVEILKADIAQRGQIDPVGIATLRDEDACIVIYGFTRTEAIIRLGLDTIRANVYDGLSPHDASVLNATNNSMHNPLSVWERALQIKKMKKDGVKVISSDQSEDTIANIYNMSRRTVYNWLKIVEYSCSDLHRAIADGKIGLRHALKFVDYDPKVTVELLDKCVEEEWSSKILDLKLKSATVAQDEELSTKSNSESATVAHENELSTKLNSESATVAQDDKTSLKRNIDRAAEAMLNSKADDILALSADRKEELSRAIRKILEVLL